MRRRNTVLLCAVLALAVLAGGCAGFQVKDPARVGLYAMKEEAVAIREYVITEHLAGRVDAAALAKYKALDDKFTALYRITVSLYLGGSNPAGVEANTKALQEILLELRRSYYPRGG
jgi:osmotically-inducible protein OsmY